MTGSNRSGRIVVGVVLLAAVAAIIAVLALGGGESRPGPTDEPLPQTPASVDPSLPAPRPEPSTSRSEAPSPAVSRSVATSAAARAEEEAGTEPPQSHQAGPATPAPSTEAPPSRDTVPDDVAIVDPDASAKAAVSSGADSPQAQVTLEDVPTSVGEWISDDELGPVTFTKAGGTLDDTITVVSMGAEAAGLAYWRSTMSGPAETAGGVCGDLGGVAACVLPSAAFGEVMLYGAQNVALWDVREVAEGVAAELG